MEVNGCLLLILTTHIKNSEQHKQTDDDDDEDPVMCTTFSDMKYAFRWRQIPSAVTSLSQVKVKCSSVIRMNQENLKHSHTSVSDSWMTALTETKVK